MSVNAEEIMEFLAEDLGIDTSDVQEDTLLFSTGIIDSFALVSLMSFLEKEGHFRINPIDVNLENMDSIKRIVTFVDRAKAS